MLGIILALSVALAAAGRLRIFELDFATSKTYIYAYEGLVLSGLQERGFAKSGLKLKCRAEISGAAPRLRFLKIQNIEIQEYNGIWPTDKFTSSSKLTRLLEKQLAKPIKFEYNRGQVGDLHIPNGLSETTVNILRGIVNILQLTIRRSQDTYIVQENGIGGFCYNNYLIQENQNTNQLLITKSIDLKDCEQRQRKVIGNAYFHTCASCKQRNKNSRAAATYSYKVKGTEQGGRLLEAEVREVHQFTPFNEIEGSLVVEARQSLVLQAVQEQIHSTPENNDYITKESLRYHFERKLIQTPIHLLRTKNTESRIDELLHHLVQHNVGPLSKVSPEKFMELVHHLRGSSYDRIESLWKQYSGRIQFRRWFLDAVPAIGNHLSLRFLKVKLRELSEFEAAQSVPLALHLIKADREAIAEAKSLLEAIKSRHDSLLRTVTYLAYGSLVYKFCSREDLCPEDVLQPLHDLLSEATEAVDKEDMILALKTLENAGQVVCIKRIMKFIPGFSSLASTLPVTVQVTAVLSLRNIALRHPSKVLDIWLQLYMDSRQHPAIRMTAARLILDNKPPAAVVMTMAKSLVKEVDMNVGSTVYYLIKRQSKSVTPDLQDVASVCNVAVLFLKSKYETTGNTFSSGFYYSTFIDSLMSGTESTFTAYNPADVLPSVAFGRLRTYFMGVFTDLFEIGYHAEGLQELLMSRHLFSSQSGLENVKKIMDMLKKLHDWKPISSSEPVASLYLRLVGQEIFYHSLNKNSLESILKFLPSGRSATLRSAVNALQNGVDINWSKSLLSSENRLVEPTCVGLPLETSLYYSSVTRAQLQAQAHITPEQKDPSLTQLLQSNLNLNSKFSLSMTKDIVFMFGVNTELIQAGIKLRTQVNMLLPGNVEAAVNVDQNHFKIDYIPVQQENEVLSIRSKAFAITRNAEDLAAAKMTPVVAAGTEPNVLKQTFNPRDLSAGDTPRTEPKFSAEVLSKENVDWSYQPHRQDDSQDFTMCARTSHFGFQVCWQKSSLTAGFAQNCPLYHMIGEHSFKLIVKPAHADASVEKIQIEFQAGPGAAMKMVRSVNVRRTDGETHKLENPIEHMALSKLKKILSSDDAMLEEGDLTNTTSTSSNESLSKSGNSSSSVAFDHESNQEGEHKPKIMHRQNHQNKRHQKHKDESRQAHHSRGHHEGEIHEPKDHHNKKKEMEIHCKCWPKIQQTHTKNQHGQVEHDKNHKSHDREVYESNQKGLHQMGQNKNPPNTQDKSHHHVVHHEGHDHKSLEECEGHQHHPKNLRKARQRDETSDNKHQDKIQHPQGEQEGCHCKDQHKDRNEREEDKQHKFHDQKEQRNTDKRPHQEGSHQESKDGQTDKVGNCNCQHKPQPEKEEDGHHYKNHHKDRNEREEDNRQKNRGQKEHYDTGKQAHQAGGHQKSKGGQTDEAVKCKEQHKTQHGKEEDDHHYKDQHKDRNEREEDNRQKNHGPKEQHDTGKHPHQVGGNQKTKGGQTDEAVNCKQQHKTQHGKEEDDHHYKDQHKDRNEGEEDNRNKNCDQKEHHKTEKRPHQADGHREAKGGQTDEAVNCKQQHKPQHIKEEDDHHYKGQPKDRNEREEDNRQKNRGPKEQHDTEKHPHQEGDHYESKDGKCHCTCWRRSQRSSSSSSSSESSSQSMQMANSKKDPRRQSSEKRSVNKKIHDNEKTQTPKKHWDKGTEDDDVNKKQKNDHTRNQKVHWKTIRKNTKTFPNPKNCTNCDAIHSRKSSKYMELFAPQIVTSKFWSTSKLLNLSSGSPAMAILLVKSFMSNAQRIGIQTTAYIDPVKLKAQAIAVPLDHKSSWKTCFDASVSGFHKASAMLRWGANCQDYKVVGQLSTGTLAGAPAAQLSWQWKRLPSWLKSTAGSLMRFVPGAAYLMGFSESHHSNPSHQATLRVAATSQDTYDTILKMPDLTFYKQAMPIPWDLSLGIRWLRHLQLIELTNLPKVSSMVRGTHEAGCTVDPEKIITFDGTRLSCSPSSTNCYTVIAQDCTNQLRFLIGMKKMGQGFSTFEMNVKLGSSDIKIYFDSSKEFRVLLNGMWLLLKNDTYTNEKDSIKILRNATTVTVKAPKNGIEQVSFNGKLANVRLTPLMRGKTCGLCGNADQHPENDFQKPNQQIAKSCSNMVHSWTVPESSCGSSCALDLQYIMMENELIEERQSTCYSTEPVLKCAKGCHPATTVPITVAFHCLPPESAVRLEDWQANPKVSSDDLIKEVEAHSSCVCTEECGKI
ncbi:vitellogenin-1-like [Leptodactylus fuscus]